MTIAQAIDRGVALLREAGVETPEVDAGWLLGHVTGRHHLQLRLERDGVLTQEEESRFLRMIDRRAMRVPLQHLLGTQPFLGRDFRTDGRALIPRSETELLVEMTIQRINQMEVDSPRVVDVGTGTGCIALSIALACPQAQVTGLDISPDALALARENAAALGASLRLVQSDLLAALSGEMCHLIISNPPYIPTGALPGLQPEVHHDPALALDGGADGLAIYRRLIPAAFAQLHPGGLLMLEIGSDQGETVPQLLTAAGFADVTVTPDYAGLPRMVTGRKL